MKILHHLSPNEEQIYNRFDAFSNSNLLDKLFAVKPTFKRKKQGNGRTPVSIFKPNSRLTTAIINPNDLKESDKSDFQTLKNVLLLLGLDVDDTDLHMAKVWNLYGTIKKLNPKVFGKWFKILVHPIY